NPSKKKPLRFVNTFERNVGGADLNFAIGCARLGLETSWISCLGDDEFGRYIRNYARGEGINTSKVRLIKECNTSLNFKEIRENGMGQTYYYRNDSPINNLSQNDLNEEHFKKSNLLHISGVFLAISNKNNKLKELVEKAIKLAKNYGLLVSFDPNIRLKLWSKEEAKQEIKKILPYVDILITGEDEGKLLFNTDKLEEVLEECKSYNFPYFAIKRGENGAIGK